jgi:hypothetical protein
LGPWLSDWINDERKTYVSWKLYDKPNLKDFELDRDAFSSINKKLKSQH